MTQSDIPSNIAFTPSVKAIQSRKGSRDGYAQMEKQGGWQSEITPGLADFLKAQRSLYLASVNQDGHPYIQHRGGPPGFVCVLENNVLGFADYRGNRQYITQGNLEDNAKAFIFLMDYAQKRRIKIWGEARIIEGDEALITRLMPDNYRAKPEQAILFRVKAWDANCPQHIPQRFEADDVRMMLIEKDARIEELTLALAKYETNRH